MLIKVSSLSECMEKGFTLERQIEHEAEDRKLELMSSALGELEKLQKKAKSPAVAEALRDPRLRYWVKSLVHKQAYDEVAVKYRPKEAKDGT